MSNKKENALMCATKVTFTTRWHHTNYLILVHFFISHTLGSKTCPTVGFFIGRIVKE